MKKNEIVVSKPFLPPFFRYIFEIHHIWKTGWLTNDGPKYKKLKKDLKNYLEIKDLELFVNGHQALEIVINALDLKGEIITTPFTFISTTNAILRNNIKPIFCDININDFTIDTNQIEKLITDKTSAIIPVHIYGNIANVEEIEKIAKKNNLKVIYDAAHAFGIKYKSKAIGNFGDASMFSLHATKVYNSIEGGIITTDDNELIQKLSLLRNFGISNKEIFKEVGTNAKMNEFQAAMGICNLEFIEKNILKRKKLFYRYIENLKDIDGVKLPIINSNTQSNYSYFPILINKYKYTRDEIFNKLKNNQINARKYFYPLTSTILSNEIYENTPVADYVSKNILVLPLHTYLRKKDVDYICKIIIN